MHRCSKMAHGLHENGNQYTLLLHDDHHDETKVFIEFLASSIFMGNYRRTGLIWLASFSK